MEWQQWVRKYWLFVDFKRGLFTLVANVGQKNESKGNTDRFESIVAMICHDKADTLNDEKVFVRYCTHPAIIVVLKDKLALYRITEWSNLPGLISVHNDGRQSSNEAYQRSQAPK